MEKILNLLKKIIYENIKSDKFIDFTYLYFSALGDAVRDASDFAFLYGCKCWPSVMKSKKKAQTFVASR